MKALSEVLYSHLSLGPEVHYFPVQFSKLPSYHDGDLLTHLHPLLLEAGGFMLFRGQDLHSRQ